MMSLAQAAAAIGAGVVYRPYPGSPAEDGEIVRVSDTMVFVLYVGDHRPKATRPADLSFVGDSR